MARRQQRLPRPSPHHPLLLIASRSVETHRPGAKAPGLFCCHGPRARLTRHINAVLAQTHMGLIAWIAGFSEVRVVEAQFTGEPMQVFGLPGHIIRSARGASRLLAAQTPNIEAARRRDALARWRNAMAQGLSSQQGAEAVGVPRSTLYRWQARADPRAVGHAGCANPSVHKVWPKPSSARAWITPCGARKSSGRSCAHRATPHPTPPSGGSSARSSGAERFSPFPP